MAKNIFPVHWVKECWQLGVFCSFFSRRSHSKPFICRCPQSWMAPMKTSSSELTLKRGSGLVLCKWSKVLVLADLVAETFSISDHCRFTDILTLFRCNFVVADDALGSCLAGLQVSTTGCYSSGFIVLVAWPIFWSVCIKKSTTGIQMVQSIILLMWVIGSCPGVECSCTIDGS